MEKEDDNIKALLWSYEIIVRDEELSLEEHADDALREKLAKHLDHLLATDFNKLVSILYRIDISQEKAIIALAEKTKEESAGKILARMIIERQLEKVISRRKYKKE